MYLIAGALEGALIGGAIGAVVGLVIWAFKQFTTKSGDDQ